jgi:hypothetical protein
MEAEKMKAGHTPGKWEIHPCGGIWAFFIGTQDEVVSNAHTEANARLISAAPEMLSALAGLMIVLPADVKNEIQGHIDAAEKALLKARGQ